jgi:hypothetical protein
MVYRMRFRFDIEFLFDISSDTLVGNFFFFNYCYSGRCMMFFEKSKFNKKKKMKCLWRGKKLEVFHCSKQP